MAKVTIAVPVYGVERYIERCAVSLFSQTYPDIEFLFVDDCGNDRSIEILRKVSQRYPERKESVRIVSHDRNRGLAAARNTAVSEATGQFILHVDSDDYVDPRLVEKLVAKQEEGDYDIVSCDFTMQFRKGDVPVKTTFGASHTDKVIDLLSRRNHTMVWGRLMRRSLYTDNNLSVAEGVNMAEDFQIVPIIYYFSTRSAHIDETLYFYNCANESSFQKNYNHASSLQAMQAMEIVARFFADKPRFAEATQLGWINTLLIQLFITARSGDKDLHSIIRKKLKPISRKYYRNITPLTRRMVLYLSPSLPLLRAYVKLGHLLKRNSMSE